MDADKVGNAIAYLRKKAGYTQKDLADRIGVSDKAVSKWERGLGMPDISYLRKLAILLDTTADNLLAGDVIYHDNIWQGVLILDDSLCGIGADTIIYDKPLICYLLSYYLLVGIKNVLIVCPQKDKDFIDELFLHGRKLGISIECHVGSLNEAICEHPILRKNVMLVYGRCFLYGVDQTRFFQQAMMYRDRLTILALPKKGSHLSNRIMIDQNSKVVNFNKDEPLRTQYDYYDVPILFCPKDIFEMMAKEEEVSSFIIKYAKDNELYAEMLDRGFVEISIDSWREVNEASTFIKIVQDKCGMNVYCIEEVAWRRGMISLENLHSLGEQKADTEYGDYILSLCGKNLL